MASGGGDEALLLSMYDHMGSVKELIDTATEEESWSRWLKGSRMAASGCLKVTTMA